jgi:hypothetical protein
MWRRVDFVNRRFGGTYRLHLQGRKIRERGTSVSSHHTISTRRQIPEDGLKLSLYPSLFFPVLLRHVSGCSHLLTLVPRSRIFLPWRWRRYVPPKRRFTQDLHGATSQKTDSSYLYIQVSSFRSCFIMSQVAATCSRWFLARGFFYHENGGDTFLRNVGLHKIYTAPHPRRRHSSTLIHTFDNAFYIITQFWHLYLLYLRV